MTETQERHTKLRIFTKDFFLLFGTNFICCAVYFLMITMTAGYAIAMFSCSEALAGWAASIFMVGAVVGRLAAGHVPEERHRSTAIALLILMTVSCAMYFLTSASYLLLLFVRITHGFAFGLGTTMLMLLSMRKMPPERLGEGVGYFTLSVTLGTAIGPMMGLFVVAGFDYETLFTGCTIAAVLGTCFLLLVKKDECKTAPEKPEEADAGNPDKNANGIAKPKLSIFNLIDKGTWSFSVFIFILGIAYAPLNAFISAYAFDVGMGVYGPFVFLVYAICLVFSRPIAGRLLDRHGHNFVLIPSIACMAIGLVICALATNPVMLLLVGVFMALGFGTAMSCSQAAVTKMSLSTNSTTMAVSTQFLFADSGNAIGPALLGMVAVAYDYRIMYLACAVISIISLAYFIANMKLTAKLHPAHKTKE